MLNLENLKKQAKLLVRWHREGNYSVGGRIRQLPRYQSVTDLQAVRLKFSLGEAQDRVGSWPSQLGSTQSQLSNSGEETPSQIVRPNL